MKIYFRDEIRAYVFSLSIFISFLYPNRNKILIIAQVHIPQTIYAPIYFYFLRNYINSRTKFKTLYFLFFKLHTFII